MDTSLLKKLTDQVPGLIFQYKMYPDGTSRFPYASDGILDIYELNPEEVFDDATLVFQRIYKDDLDKVVESVQESFNTLRLWNLEFRALLPDKGIRWLNGIARPEQKDDGSVIWHGYIIDITDRKQVEDQLKESEEKFSKIGHSALDAVIMINDQGNIEYWNPAAETMFGYKADTVKGKNVHDLIMPEIYREQYENGWRNFPVTGKGSAVGQVLELTSIRSNGEFFPIEIALSAIQVKGKFWAAAYIRDITERKKAEHELLESKQQFELAVNGTNDGIWDWDIRNNSLYISKRWKEMLGYEDHELENNFDTFVKLLHRNEQTRVSKFIQQYLNGEIEQYEIEFRMIHKDGSPRWILAKGEALRTADGLPYRMAGSHSDITNRKIQEEKIRKQKAYTESILAAIPDLMFVLNTDGVFKDVKEGHSVGLFLPRELFIGNNIKDVLPEPLPKKVKEGILELLNKKFPEPIQYQLAVNDKLRDYEARLTLADEESVICMVRDITDQKTAERELKRQFELQDILMNIASEYINIPITEYENTIDRSLMELGLYTNADRAYIFDYDWDNNVCNNTYEWCREGITPQIDELQLVPLTLLPEWIKAHKKGEILFVHDVESLPDDSGTRQVLEPQGIKSLIALPMMQGKECIGFVGFDSVIRHYEYSNVEKMLLTVFAEMLVNLRIRSNLESNLIKEKIRAESANKAESEFLANMSHEIRTPMNSILGFSEVMLNSVTDEKYKSYLQTILSSGKTLLSLINDILDLSKIEAGRLEIIPEPVNLRVILYEMQQIFTQKADNKNIDLILEIDDDIPSNIIIDEIRLRQILLNLMGNAIKFTHAGYVKVTAEKFNESQGKIDLSISVIDTGIGIPEQHHERIFESFSQQSGQDSRKYGGTGLGLSITKRLCELMGGKITLESHANEGSRFSIFFSDIKYSDDVLKSEDDYLWEEDSIIFKRATVLIVDDVLQNRELVMSYLSTYDLVLYEAGNGEIAINSAIEYLPDLILMDIRMPGMNGYQATEELKANHKTSTIPVIALTASSMQSETEKINTLFDGYLRKPIKKKELVNEIAKFIEHDIIDTKINGEIKPEPQTDMIIPESLSDKLKGAFIEQFSEKMNYLKDVMIIDEIIEFADEVIKFSEDNQLSFLKIIAEDLKHSIAEFDFDQIGNNFDKIKKIFM
jgi:PAS domain S-box-containing protein